VGTSPGALRWDLKRHLEQATACINRHSRGRKKKNIHCWLNHIELIIIDEVERLTTPPWNTCGICSTAATLV